MNSIRIADSRLSDRLEDQCSAPCEAEAAAELETASPDRPSNGCRAPSLSSASLSDAALASLLMSAVGSPAPEARWIFHRDSQDSQTGLDDISSTAWTITLEGHPMVLLRIPAASSTELPNGAPFSEASASFLSPSLTRPSNTFPACLKPCMQCFFWLSLLPIHNKGYPGQPTRHKAAHISGSTAPGFS